MRVYYMFKINDSFTGLYKNKTFYLYKMFEQISKSSKSDFIISYRLFSQMASTFNKSNVNGVLYKSYFNNSCYDKILNKHIYDDGVEKTKLMVYNTYIKIKTNKNITCFFKYLAYLDNVFVCDFKNKDYFWLNKVAYRTCVK